MREFNFSQQNLTRIGREYRQRRKALQYAKAGAEWAASAGERGYRNPERWIAEAAEILAKAEAAFAEIKAERDDYRARGFCR